MLHFNRKTEYALLAVEYMARKEKERSSLTSAREISETYHIPYPLLAKIMQKLAGKGYVKAVHGTKGGYTLTKRPEDVTVAAVVEIFDGPVAVAECFKEEKITCPQWDGCHIREPFYELNQKIYELLVKTTTADLLHKHEATAPQPSSYRSSAVLPAARMKEVS